MRESSERLPCGIIIIYHFFFVDEEYHHRGIGRDLMRRMCEYLKKEEGERYMSLKAAPYAVEFYRKLGFHAVHEEEAFSGIRVTPMEKFL
ncbi:MAG: GNAT family N-acetyltransferase [Waltera sp.]